MAYTCPLPYDPVGISRETGNRHSSDLDKRGGKTELLDSLPVFCNNCFLLLDNLFFTEKKKKKRNFEFKLINTEKKREYHIDISST